MTSAKRAEERSGSRGERLAADFLQGLGYRIEARNLRTAHGEIDVLARDGTEWVAVEVKARLDHPAPEATVRTGQLDRIERSLRALARSLRPRPTALRIDIVAVRWTDPEPEVRHFRAIRRWTVGRFPCGSPSLSDLGPADIWSHEQSEASVFRRGRNVIVGLRRCLNWIRACLLPPDADSR